MYQWRKFQFFDKDVVKDEGSTKAHSGIEKLEITCSTSGRGYLVFGDSSGQITMFDHSFKSTTFQAYLVCVTHVCQVRSRSHLVTVGDDGGGVNNGTIKVWNLEKTDKDGSPLCLKTVKVFSAKYPSVPVTCFASTDDLSLMAVGLANGEVVIVRDRAAKNRVFESDSGSPVTSLGFKRLSNGWCLFVVTQDSVISYRLLPQGEIKEELDVQGADSGCCVMNDEGDLVVARPEAVYMYQPEGRGSCFAFEGIKESISWFRGYLVVVSLDPVDPRKHQLTIYDLKHKLVAYAAPFPRVTHLLHDWGSVFVVCQEPRPDGTPARRLYQLEEKDVQTKLEMLFKKNMYSIAIFLAQSQQFDPSYITDIFSRYGDHLYSKGDHDGAIVQYIRTIGRLEPSYVIRKFLDSQRIHNLTKYLEALHEKGHANPDHTTLLLNCYTKLKDVAKLDAFITAHGSHPFDVETAIKACRQAGYHSHALHLARAHGEHNWLLKILLEDLGEHADALAYIASLPFYEAEDYTKRYGKQLIAKLPVQATALLIELCTEYEPKPDPKQPAMVQSPPTLTRSASSFDSPLTDPREALFSMSSGEFSSKSGNKPKSTPDDFIHAFVDQPHWLMVFLENITAHQGSTASTLLWNTLLEIYLRQDDLGVDVPLRPEAPTSDSDRQRMREDELAARRAKALELLHNAEAKYDVEHALVLVQAHDFREGILYLYERMRLFDDIVQYHMKNKDYPNVIRSAKRYGERDFNMWIQVLTYFASQEGDFTSEISEVLSCIDKDNMVPPLLIVQILSQNPKITLSTIKEYITRRLQQEAQLMGEDREAIQAYQAETKKMREEIKELSTSAKIFQTSKCVSCSSALDLPAVHFLCLHSFHQRCLGDNDECPVCAPNNRKVLEIKRSMEESAEQHDQFFKQLEGSSDGFSTVAEYFGRGIFNRVIMVNDPNDAAPSSRSEREMLFGDDS